MPARREKFRKERGESTNGVRVAEIQDITAFLYKLHRIWNTEKMWYYCKLLEAVRRDYEENLKNDK